MPVTAAWTGPDPQGRRALEVIISFTAGGIGEAIIDDTTPEVAQIIGADVSAPVPYDTLVALWLPWTLERHRARLDEHYPGGFAQALLDAQAVIPPHPVPGKTVPALP